ncbi:MAG: S41 family peptidase [Armatimonadota bacterium]
MKARYAWLLAVSTALAAGGGAYAQGETPAPLDAAARARAIDGVLLRLREGYVFPEVAEKMEKSVRERAANGAYDKLDGPGLAQALTADLRAVSNDKHVRVGYSAEVLPPEPERPDSLTPEMAEELRKQMARDNFGLEKLDILKGNVGYLSFRLLAPPEVAAETYAAAMTYLTNTDALIIDLRRCGGSISPDAIPMLCTYFFEKPTHLNDIYWRPENTMRQFWTWAHVPGKRYLGKPIYILTSPATFSGAEELAYDLQNLKRAVVVGETTGGGANPGGDRRADDHFTVWVPVGRAINPISKTNWEGVGVKPDVEVPVAAALHRAHTLALRKVVEAMEAGPRKEWTQNLLAEVERSAPALKKVTFRLEGYPEAREVRVAGTFNSWTPELSPLVRKGDAWTAEVLVEPGRHAYKFVVDGRWMVDPANPEREGEGEFVNSIRVVQ